MNCNSCVSAMPDLLLDSHSTSGVAVSVRSHLDNCHTCKAEFLSLQSTFALLDLWKAPAPSPYFDQRLTVLLREEQGKTPEGWLERLRSRVLFNTGRQFRHAVAGAFALALILGGSTFAGISSLSTHPAPVQASATVDDLQILDKNAQAIQQMDQLLQEDQSVDDTSVAHPTT